MPEQIRSNAKPHEMKRAGENKERKARVIRAAKIYLVFLWRPAALVQCRVQHVDKSLATLNIGATRYMAFDLEAQR